MLAWAGEGGASTNAIESGCLGMAVSGGYEFAQFDGVAGGHCVPNGSGDRKRTPPAFVVY
jgi:hypothetical protein